MTASRPPFESIPSMFNWFGFLSYAVISTITPGPNNLMSMANASRMGLRRCIPFNFGIWVGFSAVMLLCTAFCTTLSTLIPAIMTPMLAVGAGYMLWLAWITFRRGPITDAEPSKGTGFLAGMLLQFVNPKIYVYCIVAMQAFILPVYRDEPWLLVLFALLMATIGASFNILWALFGVAFRILFSGYARLTNTIMAALLVMCAVSLFF